MFRTEKIRNSEEKAKYHIPRKVQDLIEINEIWNDGIFRSNQKFSKVFSFTDINFTSLSDEDKNRIMIKYINMIHSIDNNATVKLTVNNKRLNKEEFRQEILMSLQYDYKDIYRSEMNEILLNKAENADCIIQDRYFTVSAKKGNINEAREYFNGIETILNSHLKGMGSMCSTLNAQERLRILHNFYRRGEENHFHFDATAMKQKGHDFKDYICPDSMEIHSDYLMMGDKYARVMYIKDYASFLDDSFLQKIMAISRNTMLSMDIYSIPTEEAVRIVQNKLLGVETNLANWQRVQNNNNNFSATPPYEEKMKQQELKGVMNGIMNDDQRLLQSVITMVISADTLEELEIDTKNITSFALSYNCQMVPLRYRQTEGLKTVLPMGVRKINTVRTFISNSIAAFLPYKVQEIMEKGGIYFGENAISHNLIICNRESLMNQSMIVLGVPGSGKSVFVKSLILSLMLNTNDDVIVCDPEGEYVPIADAMEDEATVIRVTAGGKDKINAMEMVDGYGENNPIVVKSQFIMSLIEQIDKSSVGPQHKSIIDRCIKKVYKEARKKKIQPTLSLLREKLLAQPEDIAKDIALSLELYTEGSLDIFGKESTVDMSKRMVVFDIHSLSPQLKPTGLLVITDAMLNRVTDNWKKGKKTHLFIDEYHVVFENEYSAAFFSSAWRQYRKRGGYPTAVTQNVETLLESADARTMLSNSEFIALLNQAASDRARLSKMMNISEEQMGYITDAQPGCGLIKYGSSLVPFINKFPEDTLCYQLITTKPGEGVFGKGEYYED